MSKEKQWTKLSLFQFWFISILAAMVALQIGFIFQIVLLSQFKPISTSFTTNEYNRLCNHDFTSNFFGNIKSKLKIKPKSQSQPTNEDDNIQEQCTIKTSWINYEDMGQAIKKAVIASEDANFSEHNGIEIDSMLHAWEKNNKKGKISAGGSTITQQLAKNLFLSSEKNYIRKVQELLLTFYLEFILDKKRILEIYLNKVEWGEGVFGIEEAAKYYYNVTPDKLSNHQAAKLAAALPAPKCFDDEIYCENVHLNFNKKANIIARRMGVADIPSDDADNISKIIKKHKKRR
jgi:monofunctional glycosyltransferase